MEIEQVKFDNYSLKIGKEWFMWKVFISKDEPSDKLNKVRNVEYKLPEFFPDPIRLVDNRNTRFALNSTGREEFQIFITVYLEDNTKIPAKVRVDLNKPWPLEELRGVNLSKANLKEVKWKGANLEGANLWGANLEKANLEGANLSGAKLTSTIFNGANLKKAIILNKAILKHAQFDEQSDLQEAQLEGANLTDAVLNKANLELANLTNANLENAGLRNAKLYGANLSNTKIRGTDLKNAIFDKHTDFRGVDYDSITIDCLSGSNWEEVALMDEHMKKDLINKYGKK